VLTDKPWRAEAIARLLAALFACTFLGSLVLTVIRFNPATAKSSTTAFYLEAGGAALALVGMLAAVAKPLTLEKFRFRFALLMTSCFAALVLVGMAQKSSGDTTHELTIMGMIVAMLSFQGAVIPLILIFTRQHGLKLGEAFGFGTRTSHAILLGATAGLAFIPIGLGFQYGIILLAKRWFDVDLAAQEAVNTLRLADSWLDRSVLGVFAVLLAPVAEEGLFRGIFYPAIRRLGFPVAALLVTSLVFAAIHNNVASFAPLFLLAVMLAKLYEHTGNLLTCIVCHATFNAFNFVMLILQSGQ